MALLYLPLALLALPCSTPTAPLQDATRLVVMISVDQLIPEQLERLASELDGGLGRLWRQGTAFQRALLGYSRTETGPGHATFATGCLPSTHGIVGNMIYDRERGRYVYSMVDPEARAVTSTGPAPARGSVSPKSMRAITLADRLRQAYPASKAFTVSFKDRAALALGGAAASPALWWDRKRGGFASSTFYGDALPEFVRRWNRDWIAAARGWKWQPVFSQDPSRWGTDADDRPGETPRGGKTTFPYVLPGGGDEDDESLVSKLAPQIYAWPLGDRFTAQISRLAVDAMELGADDSPDLLGMSFSGCDVVGHAFGPYSWEVTDMVLRLDDELGLLFAHLDERIGAEHWIAVLCADHGVLELPEYLVPHGVDAGRISVAEIGAMTRSVREALESDFGARVKASYTSMGFTLDLGALETAGIDPAHVRAVIAGVAVETPWIAAAYTLEELAATDGSDPMLALYRNCYVADRCVDVILRHEPNLLFGFGRGTSHGSPYVYDRRVPLAFLGAPFPASRRFDHVGAIDAVPTILSVLGMDVPEDLDGQVLAFD